jgi:transposase
MQALSSLHRVRAQLVSQRTAVMNALRSDLAEFGIASPHGRKGAGALLKIAADHSREIPKLVRKAYAHLADAMRIFDAQVAALDRQIEDIGKRDTTCARLETIPGVGRVIASTLVATVGDPSRFSSSRHFAAWLGLTPLQRSSGGRSRIGHISKAEDKALRTLFVMGAFSLISSARSHRETASPWLLSLLRRRPKLVAAVAMAHNAPWCGSPQKGSADADW